MLPSAALPLWLTSALLVGPAFAQTAQQAAVQVQATVASNPPAITFTWPADATATGYTVARRLAGTTTWGTPLTIPGGGTAVSWTDAGVTLGTAYEYWFSKTGSPNGRGFIQSGIAVPAVHTRGALVLFVDATQVAGLGSRLPRLVDDLVGDGWTVLRYDVQPGTSVASLKTLVIAEAIANAGALKAVFLLGHLPVPYAGDIDPDTHPDHRGAWPADLFYGERHGPWTDSTVNVTTAARSANWNVPGDGKYDQSSLPSDVDFAVGRVDLHDLPMFGANETTLLQQYLDKNHAWRHGQLRPAARAFVDDNFGTIFGDFPAASAWRSFAPLIGAANVAVDDFFTAAADPAGYLFAYGCGAGSYTSSQGIGTTADFTSSPNRCAFTLLFGSYYGDWDTTDNFLRAPLASGWTLASLWSGRPQWSLHPFGLGESIGTCAKTTQNDLVIAGLPTGRSVHVALMGDPTLRQHMIAPPPTVSVQDQWPQASGQWTASPDVVAGYHVYRAADPLGPFTLLNPSPVAGTSFVDVAPPIGTSTYMVRATRLEVTPSGSYWNLSQGITTTVFLPQTPASHTAYGTGCYAISDSFYASYATPAAAAAVLDGSAFVLTPNGASYFATREPALYVTPGPGAVLLPLGDDTTTTVALPGTLFFRGGAASTLYVNSNGLVSSAPLQMSAAQSATPNANALLGEPGSVWCSWHDFDPTAAGSGSVKAETIGSICRITWQGVACVGGGTATVQFQFDTSNGVVRIATPSLGGSTSGSYLLGYSPPGASVDGGSADPTAVPLQLPSSNVAAIALSANPPPVSTATNGTMITYTVDHVPEAAPGSGVYFGLVVVGLAAIPGGLPLSFANMPGCWLYVDQQVTSLGFLTFANTANTTLWVPPGVPIGAQFTAQAAALIVPNSLPNGQNAFGAVTSNAVQSFVSVL